MSVRDPPVQEGAKVASDVPRPLARAATQSMWRRFCHCEAQPRQPRHPCGRVPVDPARVEFPDLAIYSQEEQLAAGNPPSWDSPDIMTNDWGPFRLMPEAHVIVRNLSSTPAVNALVHYYVSPFGIGLPARLLQTRLVSLPATSQLELLFPLDQSTLGGDPRVGVQIVIEHPHDPRLINNHGAQVHDGSYTSEVGYASSLQIPVLNDSNFGAQIDLVVLPSPIAAVINPVTHVFTPHEQIVAQLDLNVPAGLTGQQSVTVVGRLVSGELVGGVTKLIRIDS